MRVKLFAFIIVLNAASADLFQDLLWKTDHSRCRGVFLPLRTDLKHLPENQTTIETGSRSSILLGKGADLNDVTLRQDNVKVLSAKTKATFDENNQVTNLDFLAQTSYQSPKFVVSAQKGKYNLPRNELLLKDVSYRLDSQQNIAWGKAVKIERNAAEQYTFHDATLSFCPPGLPIWSAKTDRMYYDPNKQTVSLDNPSFRLNDHELLQLPYISFPTSGRQSGLLRPDVGYTKEYGLMYMQPYYFNLANNYDLVLAPLIYSKGSIGFNAVARYLTRASQGEFNTETIWDDRVKSRRYQSIWQHNYRPWAQSDVAINVTKFSDSDWFRDFGNTFHILDTLHPMESIAINQGLSWGEVVLDAVKYKNNFVTGSSMMPDNQEVMILPYKIRLMPGLGIAQRIESGHFYHIPADDQASFGASVYRVVGDITLQQEFIRPYGYWRNYLGETFRYYHSDGIKTETSSIPNFSSEAGLFFERYGKGFHQTLSPKIFYVYVPYKSQYEYPIIDASIKSDSNLGSIFSRRRFQGSDRIGDENAVVLGVSTGIHSNKTFVELELGKQINIKSPKLCLEEDCADDSYAYNPLVMTLKGSSEGLSVKTDANYDMSLKKFKNVGVDFDFNDFFNSNWKVRYAYDRGTQDDSSGTSTNPLSRLGLKQTWFANSYLTIDGSIVKEFNGDDFVSYELGSKYSGCCWSSRVSLGRRYIGEGNDSAQGDDYQWYGGFEFYLKGFSHKPVIKIGSEDQHEILEMVG